jgi:NADH-quinone oxidoreductase subunit L
VLIVLSTVVGALITPPLAGVLPQSVGHAGGDAKHSLELASGIIAIAGIVLAALLFLGQRRFATAVAQSAPGRLLSAWWFAAWGFDWLYDKLFVRPYLLICRLLGRDPIDLSIGLLPLLARGGHFALRQSQTGNLRWYATSIVGGAVLVLATLLLLN